MPIIKTYDISFWAGQTLTCAMQIDGHNLKQVKRTAKSIAHDLDYNLHVHYADMGHPWKGKVKAIVNLKK